MNYMGSGINRVKSKYTHGAEGISQSAGLKA